MKNYKVASLFAGVGGICLAFKNAGADIVWANEIDPSSCATYRENFGDKYLVEGDIEQIDAKNVTDFDILTAGFPCQAFSIAGYRKGFGDSRGNLFFQIIRFLKEKKPEVVFLENVKNLISHNKGNTFRVIKETLLETGYYLKYRVLNTAQYGNIPQNRERIYIVGFKDHNKYLNFKFPSAVELTNTIHDIINVKEKKDEKYYYEKTKYYPLLKKEMLNPNTVYQWRRIYIRENKNNLCPTLTANMGEGGHNVPLIVDNFGIRKLTPRECFLFQGFPLSFKLPNSLSNSKLYKQAGNSVSVPVIKTLADNILRTLNKDVLENLDISETQQPEIYIQHISTKNIKS